MEVVASFLYLLIALQVADNVVSNSHGREHMIMANSPVTVPSPRLDIQRSSEESTSERRPWDGTDTKQLQRREHLTLFLAVHKAVLVLHRDEGCQIVGDRIVCSKA